MWWSLSFNWSMKIMKNTDPGVIEEACRVLRAGGVVMHPTETCYGFAVDIFNEEALERLYELKGRDRGQPLSVLVDSFGMAQQYGVFSDKAFELGAKYWPGPLSIIVPRKGDLPDYLNPGQDSVSIRNSSDDFCHRLVKNFGGPITTTSANLSGEAPLYSADAQVFGELAENIGLLVDGGELTGNKPSTIVKVDGEEVQILRQGGLILDA